MYYKLRTEYQGVVCRVPDGDGLLITAEDGPLRVRLRHIDAPEDGQPYAREARNHLRRLCCDELVIFRIHKWDTYGRAIAIVELTDGTDLADEMLKAGLAWWFRKYSHAIHYAGLEKTAREQKQGLWQDPNPTPPWKFRKAKKAKRTR